MQITLLSTGQVAALIGVRKHQLEYRLGITIPEPRLRFLGKRCFTPDEVQQVAAYFAKPGKVAGQEGGEACSVSNS